MSVNTQDDSRGMVEKINAVFHVEEISDREAEDKDGDVNVNEEPEQEVVIDVDDQERRTKSLEGILPTLNELRLSNYTEELCQAAEKLADGSRERECDA